MAGSSTATNRNPLALWITVGLILIPLGIVWATLSGLAGILVILIAAGALTILFATAIPLIAMNRRMGLRLKPWRLSLGFLASMAAVVGTVWSQWPARAVLWAYRPQLEEISRRVLRDSQGEKVEIDQWVGPTHVQFAEPRGEGAVFLVTGGDASGWIGFLYSPGGTASGVNLWSGTKLSSDWYFVEED